jgi:hypothetical protein
MSQIQPAPRSFYTRQAIFLSIALTAVLLGFASYLVAEVTRLSKEAAHSNAIALSTLVASSSAVALLQNDMTQLDATLQTAMQMDTIREIQIHGPDGQLLRRAKRDDATITIDMSEGNAAVPDDIQLTMGGDPPLGTLHAAMSTHPIDEINRRIWLDACLALLLGLVIGLVLLALHLRPASHSLEHLMRQAELIEQATPAVPPLHNGILEFDRLADVLHSTGLRLAAQAQRLNAQGAQLHTANMRLRGMFDAALDAIVSTNAQGQITAFNRQAERLFGLPARDVMGQSVEDVLAPSSLQAAFHAGVVDKITADNESGTHRRLGFIGQHADGREFPIEIGVGVSETTQGREYTAFIRDISDRHRYEASIAQARVYAEQAEARLRHAIESIDDGFVLYDQHDRLVLCNERYRQIYADTADLVVPGARFEDLLRAGIARGQYPQAKGHEEAWLRARLRAHQSGSDGVEQQLPNGRWLRITERRTPENDLVGFRVDITELKAAQARAEAANRAKSEFLANISHEIRTPLNGVMGMTDLVLASTLTTEQREYLELSRRSAEALLDVVNDILDFSKLEATHVSLEHAPFTLQQSCADSLRTLALRAKNKGLAFEFHDDTAHLCLIGDATRVRQIMSNLVTNAIKFTQRGQIAVHAEIIARTAHEARIRISVADTGIGIPTEKQDRIFEAFVQADASTARDYGGTGLGLAICKQLVERMSGRIWVASTTGEGSTFYVEIPFPTQTQDLSPEITDNDPVPLEQSLNILLVEDHPVNRLVAKTLLRKLGHQVTEALNGMQAIEYFSQGNQPDLVLMDIQMPGITGFETLALLRDIEAARSLSRTPIIALTAHALHGDRAHCLSQGMDGYLSKPYTRETLAIEIAAVIRPRAQT